MTSRTDSHDRLLERLSGLVTGSGDPSRPVAFDLDGTLVEAIDRLGPRRTPAVLAPIAQTAWTLLSRGVPLAIVTGRECPDETASDVMRALEHAAGRPLTPEERARVAIEVGGKWSGLRTAVRRKAETLGRIRALCIVGDLPHLDGAGAKAAGVPYFRVG